MRRITLAAIALTVCTVSLSGAAAPARADHYLDRLRDEFRLQRNQLDDRYHNRLSQLTGRYNEQLQRLNDNLRHARQTTHGLERIYYEQFFAQQRTQLAVQFQQRQETLRQRWLAQRDELRAEYQLARERYESRPPFGVPQGPPQVVFDPIPGPRPHVGRPRPVQVVRQPTTLDYIQLVASLFD